MRHTIFLLLLLINVNATPAAITTIAMSGDEVPGIPGAKFDTFDTAKINTSGDAAFTAHFAQGVGGISSANDHAILTFNGTNVALIAQEGSGNVPGAIDTSFSEFLDFTIDDLGSVTTRARLALGTGGVNISNNNGLWQFKGGQGAEIARTATANAPGVPARFESLDMSFSTSVDGQVAYEGNLFTEGGVTSATNVGVWSYEDGAGSLLLRENDPAPGAPTALFAVFNPPNMNNNNQFVDRAVLKLAPGIDVTNRNGIWLYEGSSGQLIARTGVGNVPGLPSASFGSLTNPVINNSGQIAFSALLTTGEQGLWRFTGSAGTNVAIGGSPNVPGVPDATFETFHTPLLYDSGEIVALASLTIGTGGVTSSDSTGLWLFQDDLEDRLLYRQGSAAPDVIGAKFAALVDFAPTSNGVLVQAVLEAGTGGVTTENDHGIWHFPLTGDPELLLRTGDQLTGRTIEDLTLPTTDGPEPAFENVSNDGGQFVFRADFTNGDSGLFLYSPNASTEYAPADFNNDGYVNGSDLEMWQGAYGTSNVGDADDDGDTDGADFLLWQRQYTGGMPPLVLAVPEPNVLLLLSCAFAHALVRIRR